MTYNQDSKIPNSVFYFFILIIVLVAPVSLGLLLFPNTFGPSFFWALKPFNTRFLGFLYSAEMAVVAILLYYKTWSPARFAIWSAWIFTGWATIITTLMYDQVVFTKTWRVVLWFVLYLGSFLTITWLLYYTRKYKIDAYLKLSLTEKIICAIHILVLGIHLAGLLISPVSFSQGYWPWPLDAFSGRFYAGVFMLALYGNYLLLTGAHAKEFFTYGVILVVFSFGVIIGLYIVDAAVHKTNWQGFNTWFWIFSSAFSGCMGLYWIFKSRKYF